MGSRTGRRVVTPYAKQLVEDRDLFRRLVTRWLVAIEQEQAKSGSILAGLRIALDEGKVATPRKVRKAGMVFEAADAVHGDRGRFVSLHHEGCALDFLVWEPAGDDFEYIDDGDHPAYFLLGRLWVQLDPRCSWGGSFNDANHIGLRRGSRR